MTEKDQAMLMSILQSQRNLLIGQVQQIEAAIELLDGKPADKPACRACGSTRLKKISTMGAGVTVCLDCNENQ